MEFKRLQRVEEEAKLLRDQISYLTEENKRLNNMPSNPETRDQLHQNYLEEHELNLGLKQTWNLVLLLLRSFFLFWKLENTL